MRFYSQKIVYICQWTDETGRRKGAQFDRIDDVITLYRRLCKSRMQAGFECKQVTTIKFEHCPEDL